MSIRKKACESGFPCFLTRVKKSSLGESLGKSLAKGLGKGLGKSLGESQA